jgi:cytochrome c oxidase cbb3-type subunit 3/ubiquinol-cytochrome c reductase cytochrome c subunit
MELLVAAIIIGMASFSSAESKTTSQETGTQTSAHKGASLYGTYCSFCHGQNGQGYLADKAPALGNQNFLRSADNDYIIQAIIQGRPGTSMSAWGTAYGGVLTSKDVKAIVSYIRKWQKVKSVDLSDIKVSGNAKNGAQIYQKHCASCHGIRGMNGKFVELDNTVFQKTASDGFIQYAILHGRPGTPMPPFKGPLTHQEINDVVAYIRTLNADNAPKKATGTEANVPVSKRRVGVLNPGKEPATFSLTKNRYVSVNEVYKAYAAGKSFILLDARPHSDYLNDHITGAVSIPFYDVKKELGRLPKTLWIITYCACPHAMSGKAADTLKAAGYNKVGVLNEGFYAWEDKGYPTESGGQ